MINIPFIVQFILVLFGYNFNKPARLEKQEPRNKYDAVFNRIAPYIIFFGIIILGLTLVVILIKYGHSFSTEANNYYYNMG